MCRLAGNSFFIYLMKYGVCGGEGGGAECTREHLVDIKKYKNKSDNY